MPQHPAIKAVLRTPKKTEAAQRLYEKWIEGHLPTSQIAESLTLATAVIGDRDKAAEWLSRPNLALDNRAPIDLIGEKDGFERVKHLLLRIEYGVLA